MRMTFVILRCHFDPTAMSLRFQFDGTSPSLRFLFGFTSMSLRFWWDVWCGSNSILFDVVTWSLGRLQCNFTSSSIRVHLDSPLISLSNHFDFTQGTGRHQYPSFEPHPNWRPDLAHESSENYKIMRNISWFVLQCFWIRGPVFSFINGFLCTGEYNGADKNIRNMRFHPIQENTFSIKTFLK